MKCLVSFLILGLSLSLSAQTKTPTPTPESTKAPEALTPMETAALQTVFTQIQKDVQILHEFEAEIAKNHPGYHIDEQSGTLTKDILPSKPVKENEKK